MRLFLLLIGIAIAALAGAQTGLPQTPKEPVVDHCFGTSVVDDYRWLENAKSDETKAWVETQNVRARIFLDRLPDRPAILAAKTAMESRGHVAYFNLSQRNGKLQLAAFPKQTALAELLAQTRTTSRENLAFMCVLD
jgi:prolyl oligopeptidase